MGVLFMRGVSIEERAVNLAQYIIETQDTVRGTAKKFGVSKSTVHTDVPELQFLDKLQIVVVSMGLSNCMGIRFKLAIRI